MIQENIWKYRYLLTLSITNINDTLVHTFLNIQLLAEFILEEGFPSKTGNSCDFRFV